MTFDKKNFAWVAANIALAALIAAGMVKTCSKDVDANKEAKIEAKKALEQKAKVVAEFMKSGRAAR